MRRLTQNKGTNFWCTLKSIVSWFKGVANERVGWGSFVGLITIDGLSNVGPKIVFDHREKERANCLIRLAFKGIRIRCPDVLRWLLLFEDVLLRVLYY